MLVPVACSWLLVAVCPFQILVHHISHVSKETRNTGKFDIKSFYNAENKCHIATNTNSLEKPFFDCAIIDLSQTTRQKKKTVPKINP